MYWYVLFTKTGYEHKTVREIDRVWKIDGLKPFVPMYDARFRRAGKVYSEKRRLCPGYIFIEAEHKGSEFYKLTRPYIIRSEYALKLLRYGNSYDGNSFEMKREEYLTFLQLYNDEYCIEMSKGLIEGDSVCIIEGPLKGHESRIKKINRHKLEAVVEMEMMGRMIELKIGLEIIEKMPLSM